MGEGKKHRSKKKDIASTDLEGRNSLKDGTVWHAT
jgi:hypothetical protein